MLPDDSSNGYQPRTPESIDDLVPAPYNPREISDAAAEGLAASIDMFGDIAGIVWNSKTGHLVAGHQRVEQLRKAGAQLFRTPDGAELRVGADGKRFAIRTVDWDIGTEKAANITANNPHIAGVFTGDVTSLLEEVRDNIGVEQFEELALGDLLSQVDDRVQEVTEDEPPALDETETVVQPGELWALGEHRLLCGDATDTADVGRIMCGARADMVFTDPPYNCGGGMSPSFYAGSSSGAMKGLAAAGWDRGFDPIVFMNAVRDVLPADGTVYVCTSHKLAPAFWSWFNERGGGYVGYIVWCKANPMPSLAKRHPTWATELIVYATNGKHQFNFPDNGHALSWWDIPTNAANTLHPTQKPVAIPARAIEWSSMPGQIIADFFLGAGSTLIAAERLERRCYGIEIDPRYCDVIIKRWETLTGAKAKRIDG